MVQTLGLNLSGGRKIVRRRLIFGKAVELRPGQDEYYFYLGVTEHELGAFLRVPSLFIAGVWSWAGLLRNVCG